MRKLLILILFLSSIHSYSQQRIQGYVVGENGDTLRGQLDQKRYYGARKVTVVNGTGKLRIHKRKIKEIHVGDEVYVKLNTQFIQRRAVGNVNLYYLRNAKLLGKSDSDITTSSIRNSLRFHCDDYPGFKSIVGKIHRANVDTFIISYNRWKERNPSSKSFYERNIHHIEDVIFRTYLIVPGAGAEFKITDNFSVQSMLRLAWGINKDGWLFLPFMEAEARYYYDLDKRKRHNQRTYNFSGNYFSPTIVAYMPVTSAIIGFQHGIQRMLNKHWYSNFSLGGGIDTGNTRFHFLLNYDFGFSF